MNCIIYNALLARSSKMPLQRTTVVLQQELLNHVMANMISHVCQITAAVDVIESLFWWSKNDAIWVLKQWRLVDAVVHLMSVPNNRSSIGMLTKVLSIACFKVVINCICELFVELSSTFKTSLSVWFRGLKSMLMASRLSSGLTGACWLRWQCT